MALIIFLRGMNVGGQRRFRPAALARELRRYDVVNVGAAGTFVVRRPGPRAAFLSELRRKLPVATEICCCNGADLIGLELENPFAAVPVRLDAVRFVSILSSRGRRKASLPIAIPEAGECFVRIMGSRGRILFGVYSRHMKTIGYLDRIDELFGVPATTRSWNTIRSVLGILNGHANS